MGAFYTYKVQYFPQYFSTDPSLYTIGADQCKEQCSPWPKCIDRCNVDQCMADETIQAYLLIYLYLRLIYYFYNVT